MKKIEDMTRMTRMSLIFASIFLILALLAVLFVGGIFLSYQLHKGYHVLLKMETEIKHEKANARANKNKAKRIISKK